MANPITPEQQAAIDAANARLEQQRAVPTQRVRSAAQGATFGTADEIEAAARAVAASLSGGSYSEAYNQALNEIRGGLKAYQQAEPVKSLGWEMGGAVAPSLIAAAVTGGSSAPATTARLLPRMAQAAKVGAAQGAGYGFGTGEGGLANRASRAVGGGIAGGIAAPLIGEATRALGAPAMRLLDIARRRLGGRGSSAVENELQRIAAMTQKTPDEIVDDLLNGRILAENETLKDTVAALRATSGPAGEDIRRTLTQRAQVGRDLAMAEMQRGLADVGDENVRRGIATARTGERAAERDAYAPFKNMEAGADIEEALADALRRVPSAADEVTMALRAETGASPFFKITEDGAVEFTRSPTVAEAESVRRAIKNTATRMYSESKGTAGEAIVGVERELRSALDQIESLAEARATASTVRSAADAFKVGQRALNQSPDQVAMDFEAATAAGPEAVSAFRAGVMDAYRNKASTGSQASLMTNISNPDRREGAVLRLVYPEDDLPDILRIIENAAASQQAKTGILGGSPTQGRQAAESALGSNVGLSDISAIASGDVVAAGRVLSKMISEMTELSQADRAKIVSVLLETDPNIVRRALVDESGLANLQRALADLGVKANIAARGASVPAAADYGAGMTGGLLAQ